MRDIIENIVHIILMCLIFSPVFVTIYLLISYQYHDCIKVGHENLYCILNFIM